MNKYINKYKCNACADTGMIKRLTTREIEFEPCTHGILSSEKQITDTERLDWFLNGRHILISNSDRTKNFVNGFVYLGEFKNPREAIDAAMKDESK